MELEGYEMVVGHQLAIRSGVAVNTYPLVSSDWVLDVEQMVPAEFRQSGLKSYTEGGATRRMGPCLPRRRVHLDRPGSL
jgi:hypothetical protein